MAKKLREKLNLPDLRNPLDFPLGAISAFEDYGGDEFIYLRDIGKYLIELKYLENDHNRIIPEPVSDRDLPKYFFAYLIGLKFYKFRALDSEDFTKVINFFPSLALGEIKDNYLNLVIHTFINISENLPFYFTSPIKDFLDAISDTTLKENVIFLVSTVRNGYIYNNLGRIEFKISQPEIESKVKLTSWPEVTNLVSLKPSPFDLARYTLHLKSPVLTEFSLLIEGYESNEELNEQLCEFLRSEALLNSANQIKAKFLYSSGDAINPPALQNFKRKTLEFLKSKFDPLPWSEAAIISNIEKSFLEAKAQNKQIREYSNFNPLKALSLTIQSLEYSNIAKIPTDLQAALISDVPNACTLAVLRETLDIAYTNLVRRGDLNCLFIFASKIVDKIFDASQYKLIIQSGDPIREDKGKVNTEHYFYIAITKLADKYKISIVNGGSNLEGDTSFDASDASAYAISRKIESNDLSAQAKDFLTNYIYAALAIQYTKATSEDHYKALLDNLYLKGNFVVDSSYFLEKSEMASIFSLDDSVSIPSQAFPSCTVHNLKYALRTLFSWEEYQFTHFVNSLYIKYNFLLKHHEEQGIIQIAEIVVASSSGLLSIDASIYDVNYGEGFTKFVKYLIGSENEVLKIENSNDFKGNAEEGNCFYLWDAVFSIKAGNTFVDIYKFYNEPDIEHTRILLRDWIHLNSIVQGNSGYLLTLGTVDVFNKFYQGEAYEAVKQGVTTLGYMLMPAISSIFFPQYSGIVNTVYSSIMVGFSSLSLGLNLYSAYRDYGTLESKLKSNLVYSHLYINLGFNEWAKELVQDSINIVREDAKKSELDSPIQNIAYEYHLNEKIVYLGLDNYYDE